MIIPESGRSKSHKTKSCQSHKMLSNFIYIKKKKINKKVVQEMIARKGNPNLIILFMKP